MKIAIYPGSFNPWHEGHQDILIKALAVFDQVIVAIGVNPDKSEVNFINPNNNNPIYRIPDHVTLHERIVVTQFDNSLASFANESGACAIIRGLRNGQDLEFEKTQQYWSEDLGLKIPILYLLCDRKLSHISSSAIRVVAKIKK
jgi:pantetheine-phosphate adenylyltransferase